MQFAIATIAAVAALLPGASAHLSITEPKMFANHMQNEGFSLDPLDPSGANFPCQNGTPDEVVPPENFLEYGKNVLQVEGSAVHGGGSGQMVITYDFPPPADEKKWRVLTSYEGNHPIVAEGNLPVGTVGAIPANHYTVWEFLPAGKATVAWSWFNHVGNREHYMKCATVSIGGSSEIIQGAMDTSALKKLPTMFRANSDNGKCTVQPEESAIKFKNPGQDVVGNGVSSIPCDTTIAGTNAGGSLTTPEKPTEPEKPKPSATGNEENEGTGDNGEDIAAPGPTPSSPVTSSAPQPPTYPPKKPDDKPTKPTKPTKPQEPAPSNPVTPPTQPSPGSCMDGEVTCNADGTWSLCGSGINHNMGGTGAGRICKDGGLALDPKWATWATESYKNKRAIRFSTAHMRRRH